MTTKEFAEVSSAMLRAMAEAFDGVSLGEAMKLADTDFLKRSLGRDEQVSTFKRDMREEGWIIEDIAPETELYGPEKFELIEFSKKKKEGIIKGEDLIGNFGQRQAEYLLEHQGDIPKAWRDYDIVFPATIWRDRRDDRRVPYLYFYGGCWNLNFIWLDNDFYSSVRLLRLCE